MEEYYQRLADNYDLRAWQFIPEYNKMIKAIADLLIAQKPKGILDIGQGTGNLQIEVLKQFPDCHFTCLDTDPGMIEAARRKLADLNLDDKVTLIQGDVLDYSPEKRFDSIVSNSVLHNVPYDHKEDCLRNIKTWLKPGANFIWGDFIKYADPKMFDYWMNYRIEEGRKRKQPEDNEQEFEKFITDSFDKERTVDSPLTIEETLELSRQVGFTPELIWLHDTFAIFNLK